MNNDLDQLIQACGGAIAKTDYYTSLQADHDPSLYLPLWIHAIDTAEVAKWLFDQWIPKQLRHLIISESVSEQACRNTIYFAALTHDVGKITPSFQNYLLSKIEDYNDLKLPIPPKKILDGIEYHPHAEVSAMILDRCLINPAISSLVYAHHGNPKDILQNSDFFCENPVLINEEGAVDASELSENLYLMGRKLYDDPDYLTAWQLSWQSFVQAALNLSNIKGNELIHFSFPALIDLAGLLSSADWVASNPRYFPLIKTSDEITDPVLFQKKRIEEGIRKLDLPASFQFPQTKMDSNLFQQLFGFSPNPMQAKVIEMLNGVKTPGLIIIESEMGSGKTEAALAAAQITGAKCNCGGAILGMPTQATTNAQFEKYKEWAEKILPPGESHNFLMEHGGAWYNEDYREFAENANKRYSREGNEGDQANLIIHPWIAGKKQNLLSEFSVCTVDHILMSVLRHRYFTFGYLGVSGKVNILDEIHSYDPKMYSYLLRYLNHMGALRTPVILLSATLPENRRLDMIEGYLVGWGKDKKEIKNLLASSKTDRLLYPRITVCDQNGILQDTIDTSQAKKTVKVSLLPVKMTDLVEPIKKIIDQELDGGALGIIVNSVNTAQKLGQALQDLVGNQYRVIVSHSRFIAGDRNRIEKEITDKLGKKRISETEDDVRNRRKDTIVIGTQTLEQSLDIDFDLMVTELAPVDILLQRIGRLWRHESAPRPDKIKFPKCYIVSGEKTGMPKSPIYHSWLLKQTLSTIQTKIRDEKSRDIELLLPDDIPLLIESVYEKQIGEALSESDWKLYQNYNSKVEKSNTKADLISKTRSGLCDKPDKTPLYGVLAAMADKSEQSALQSVRDGQPSFDVIVLMRNDNNDGVMTLPTNPSVSFNIENPLSQHDRRNILKERLKLPIHIFIPNSEFYEGDPMKLLDKDLNKRLSEDLREWKNNYPEFRNERIVVINHDKKCVILDEEYKYSNKLGFKKD